MCFFRKLSDMHAYSLLVGTRVPAKGDFLQQMKASTKDIANAKTTTRLDNRATKSGLASEKNETSNLIFFFSLEKIAIHLSKFIILLL